MSYDDEAEALRSQLTAGPRVVVIGSTSFYHADSRQLCELIAGELARSPEIVAVTGGVAGIGATFAAAFAITRAQLHQDEKLYHILPRHTGTCSTGVTLTGGDDFFERREILGRLGDVYLMVEGGPGTEHEAQVAAAHGFPVIPLARTEGASAPYFKQLFANHAATSPDWALLADATASLDATAAAAVRILIAALPQNG